MKYYVIFKRVARDCVAYPSFIVENEEVAKDFCERYHWFDYDMVDTEDKDESNND